MILYELGWRRIQSLPRYKIYLIEIGKTAPTSCPVSFQMAQSERVKSCMFQAS